MHALRILTACVLLAGCAPPPPQQPVKAPAPSPDDMPVAQLGDEVIKMRDVQPEVAFQVYQQSVAIHKLLTGAVDGLIERRLLQREAALIGQSVDHLIASIESNAAPATPADIDAYLKENPAAAAQPNAREKVEYFLTERNRIQARADFVLELRKKAGYRLLLEPPLPPRITLAVDDAPARGPATAPVTIVHFASFHSPASARSAQQLQNVMTEFDGRVRWVHRSFPRERDGLGLLAVQLAATANQHGKFWQVHDRLFQEHGLLTPESLERIALEASIPPVKPGDLTAIGDVKRDLEAARQIGIELDPVTFVNGRYVGPTFPYDQLRAMVAEELEPKSAVVVR